MRHKMSLIWSIVKDNSHKGFLSQRDIKMKKLFNTIFSVLESMGRAKAAAHLSRNGNVEGAKALMLAE